jgi:hypothetical protein
MATFTDILKTVQQKFLRPAIYILVLAAALFPLVPNPTYKYLVLFLLANAAVRVIFDIENGINRRLDSIDVNLSSPNPPIWPNFTAAQETILARVVEVLDEGHDLHLEIISVSARFSWRMVEDHLSPLIMRYKSAKIRIDVALSTEETLEKWHLYQWIHDLHRTNTGMQDFGDEHQSQVAEQRLVVNRIDYDNLSQWHGVLINKKILFLGRTEWSFRSDDYPVMRVGQCPYRMFELTDRYEGQPRIIMFENWMERLRRRNDELHAAGTT